MRDPNHSLNLQKGLGRVTSTMKQGQSGHFSLVVTLLFGACDPETSEMPGTPKSFQYTSFFLKLGTSSDFQ